MRVKVGMMVVLGVVVMLVVLVVLLVVVLVVLVVLGVMVEVLMVLGVLQEALQETLPIHSSRGVASQAWGIRHAPAGVVSMLNLQPCR